MFVQTEVKCNGWPFVEIIILKAIGALQNCTLSGTKMHLNWNNENEIVPKLCKFSSKKKSHQNDDYGKWNGNNVLNYNIFFSSLLHLNKCNRFSFGKKFKRQEKKIPFYCCAYNMLRFNFIYSVKSKCIRKNNVKMCFCLNVNFGCNLYGKLHFVCIFWFPFCVCNVFSIYISFNFLYLFFCLCRI